MLKTITKRQKQDGSETRYKCVVYAWCGAVHRCRVLPLSVSFPGAFEFKKYFKYVVYSQASTRAVYKTCTFCNSLLAGTLFIKRDKNGEH